MNDLLAIADSDHMLALRVHMICRFVIIVALIAHVIIRMRRRTQ